MGIFDSTYVKLLLLLVMFLCVFLVKNTYVKKKSYQKMLYRRKNFLTPSELKYFRILQEKYGKDHYVIPQVVLSSIVDVDLPKKFYAYKGYRSKIDKKTIDFVIFDKETFTPVLAIELDDSSHERLDRQERDYFVNGVIERVGIKMERIKSFNF